MKKFFSIFLALACLLTPVLAENTPTDYPLLGLQLTLPENMEESGLSIISNDQLMNLLYQNGEEVTALLLVEQIDESIFRLIMEDAQMKATMENNHMQLLGSQNGKAYIMFHAAAFENPEDYFLNVLNADYTLFSPAMQTGMEKALPLVKEIADSMVLIPVEKPAIAIGSFTTRDLQGNEVTESIFAGKDLTVVNVWGTFCGPCINEMPQLAAWAEELPENVQIIGIVSDVDVNGNTNTAKAIVEKTGVTFPNLLASDDLLPFLSLSSYVPTTYFLDENGVSVGDPVVGARVDQYKQFVEDYLK